MNHRRRAFSPNVASGQGSLSSESTGQKDWRLKLAVTGLGLVLVAVLGVVDAITGWEFSFSVFYLLPIILVVHWGGKWPGIILSFVSAAAWFGSEVYSDPPPPYSHFAFHYWNALVRLAFFLIITFLLTALENALQREKALADLIRSLRGEENPDRPSRLGS